MTKIRWKRSDEGFVESHCGNWKISPLYWGSTRPQSYELRYKRKKIGTWYETQSDAKERADGHLFELEAGLLKKKK